MLSAVVDALIRLDARVPVDLARKVEFSPQRLVLLSRAPDNGAALMDILAQATAPDSVEWIAAADLLAQHSPPGFAAKVMERLEPSLTIHVVDDRSVATEGGGGRSCDYGPGEVRIDWPPFREYRLSIGGGTLLAPGVHPAYYASFDDGEPPPPFQDCIPYGEDYDMPLGMAASLAHMAIVEFPLRHDASVAIHYRRSSYEPELRALLRKANDGFDRVISTYLRLGLLTRDEADRFKLPVLVDDARRELQSIPLPKPPEFRWLRMRR
jgi:hypothetical protein